MLNCLELGPNLLICLCPRWPDSALDSVEECINYTALGIVICVWQGKLLGHTWEVNDASTVTIVDKFCAA